MSTIPRSVLLAAAFATAVPFNRAGAAEPAQLPRFEGLQHVIIADPQAELGMYFHMLPAPDKAPDELLPAALEPKTRMRPVLASQVHWFEQSPDRIKDALSRAMLVQGVGVEKPFDRTASAAGGAAVAGIQRPVGLSEGAFNSAMLVGFIFAFWFMSSEYKDTLERRSKRAATLAEPVLALAAARSATGVLADRLARVLPADISVERASAQAPAEFFEEPMVQALAAHPRLLVAVPFVGMAPGLAGVRCSTMLFELVPNPDRAKYGPYRIRKTAAGPHKVPVSPFDVERTVVITALTVADRLPEKRPEDIEKLDAQARERFAIGKNTVGPVRDSKVRDLQHALDEARAPIWYPDQLAPRMVDHWTADSGAPLERAIGTCAESMQGILKSMFTPDPTP